MLSPISLISRIKILPKLQSPFRKQKSPAPPLEPQLVELQNIKIDPILTPRLKIDLKNSNNR